MGREKRTFCHLYSQKRKEPCGFFLILFAFLIRTAMEKFGTGLIVFGKFLFGAAVPA